MNIERNKMTGFEIIEKACEILGLSSMATKEEIKGVYRDLSRRYHPDRCSEKKKEFCAEKFREITRAKDILLAYIDSYRYIFTEEEFKNHLAPDSQEHFERFFFDWF